MYEDAMNYLLDSAKLMRPYHTEVAICASYSDKYTGQGDAIQSTDAIIAADVTIYADSLEEAQSMAYPFDKCPLKPIFHLPVTETNWTEINGLQEALLPSDQGLRYQCDSILNDPKIPRKQVCLSEVSLIEVARHDSSDDAKSS
jgi:hypothetical protein